MRPSGSLVHRAEPGGEERGFLRAWSQAGQRVEQACAATDLAWPTSSRVAAELVAALPEDAVLFAGSSNAARDLDLVGWRLPPGARVVASRGLAGIDGCVSTAIGLALGGDASGRARPTYALLGDLTFLHDTNGLLIGPHEPQPDLTIVVPNDDGGGIFTTLEHGDPARATDFERIFGTPTGTDLAALCAAHGVTHVRATTPEELRSVVTQVPAGLRVVEVRVDRSTHRQARAELRARAAAAAVES